MFKINGLRYVILVSLLLLLIGCGRDTTWCPDFSKKSKVIDKVTNSEDISEYVVKYTSGALDFVGVFNAPYDFASAGDCVLYEQGVIKVVPCE
jgi:hypothetical protein